MGFSLANAVRRYYWDCLSQCSSNFPTRATGRCRPCRLADAGTGSFLDIHQPPLHCSGPALDSVDWLNRNGHACRADLIDLGLNRPGGFSPTYQCRPSRAAGGDTSRNFDPANYATISDSENSVTFEAQPRNVRDEAFGASVVADLVSHSASVALLLRAFIHFLASP
jgi:hypothetical protein